MTIQYPTFGRTLAALVLAVGLAACTADKDPIGPGVDAPTFANASSALRIACAGCHHAASGRLFLTSMDSARLVASGLLDPGNPAASQLLVQPRSASHGGGVVAAFTTRDSALVAAWIRTLPNVSVTTINAVRAGSALTIDGVSEAAWLQATPLTVPIAGGWAAATSVSVRAMYDAEYVYMLMRWTDNQASYRRRPWIKKPDGTWSVAVEKPDPVSGQTWRQYMDARGGVNFNPEGPEFMYEDNMAVIWNTYGASTVPEFETVGCAAACHDPTRNGAPGTTYNAQEYLASKKYLTVAGQILDMWQWKLVRQNMNSKVHDQHVCFWVPINDATQGSGGRASDAGVLGYASNPATLGRPTYKSATRGILPPIYSWPTSDTLRMTDAEVLALPVGTVVANMMTTMPTLSVADVDGFGVYDAVLKQWTLEIRRRLTTTDLTNDVQFTDLTRAYKFGIAVFDNADNEHSYSGPVLSFRFKP